MTSLLVHREPFGLLFDEFFSDFFQRGRPAVARNGEHSPAVRARIDVVDKGDKYEVRVDLPGVKKDDINVTIEGAHVAITAESKGEKKSDNGERVLHTERYATSYVRNFELPVEVTQEGADAGFENGVLTLALPKRATVASKRLAIR